MKPLRILSLLLIAMLMLVLVACGGTTPTAEEAAGEVEEAAGEVEEAAGEVEEAVEEAAETGAGLGMEAAAVASEFFSQEELDNSIRLIDVVPEGPEGEPWNQYLEPNFIDTAQYAKEGPYTCLLYTSDAADE